MATVTLTPASISPWVAPFTGTLTLVATIGASGNGETSSPGAGAAGGGGNGYADSADFAIVFGASYNFVVPAGGSGVACVWDSGNTSLPSATAGGNGAGGVGGTGGVGTGDGTTSTGGAGADSGGAGTEGSGGGAGSAGVAGGAGAAGGVGSPGAGGAGVGLAQDGGAGGNLSAPGGGGGSPPFGGGGGGGGSLGSAGGLGVDAEIKLNVAYPTPAPAKCDPPGGSTAGGGTVVITGTNFSTGCTVLFGGATATVIAVDSDIQIRVTAPAHADGVVNVVVTNPDSVAGAPLTDGYAYVAGGGGAVLSRVRTGM